MGWYHRWGGVRAPSDQSNAGHEPSDASNCVSTPRSISLRDTSPSLPETLSVDTDLLVAESQLVREISTPTSATDILLEDGAAPTSLRQHKVKSANRVAPLDKPAASSSPVRCNASLQTPDFLFAAPLDHGAASVDFSPPLRKLFVDSPALFVATPMGCAADAADSRGTQLLFDTPSHETEAAGSNETRYSGHPLVFLPASFEQLDIGTVVSEGCHSSPVQPVGQKTVAVETTGGKAPPSTGGKAQGKRVSFVDQARSDCPRSSPPHTASVLSSLDNGRLARKGVGRLDLKAATSPLAKFDIPLSLGTGKATAARDAKTAKRTRLESGTGRTTRAADLAGVVWAKWKPDRLHYLVLADLLDQSGSSTRTVWRARLHASRKNTTVSLREGDFVRVDARASIGLACRLCKRPDVAVEIVHWQSSRAVVVKNLQTGESSTVPSRHLFVDNLRLLRPLLFAGLSFVLTCGEHKGDRMKRASIVAAVKKHGGRVVERIPAPLSDPHQQMVLLATEPKRTFKYLMAVIAGVPRVTLQWLLDCIETDCRIDLSSPSHQADDYASLRDKRPLRGQVWRVAGLEKRMQEEFGAVLKALGADIADHQPHHYDLLATKSAPCSVEHLVDCILSDNFAMFPPWR